MITDPSADAPLVTNMDVHGKPNPDIENNKSVIVKTRLVFPKILIWDSPLSFFEERFAS
jgi:hypothetical protein